jgi:hypothetical protein
MSSSSAATAMKYWFEYEYSTDNGRTKAFWSTLSTSPIQALNWYHEHMQKHADRDTNRVVTRPKLKASQYTLTLFKRDGFAPYELPITGNPDLSTPKTRVKVEPQSFEFFAETSGRGRLAS